MTDTRPETIDFTMMYLTHDALRRDLGRLTTAAAAGTARSPAVRAGWENFTAQLHLHHTSRTTTSGHAVPSRRRPADAVALLHEMEAEHAVSTRCSLPLAH